MNEAMPYILGDGYTLYLATYSVADSGDTWENWQVPIIPIVDFNGDGKVDGKDLLQMIVELGGSDALCDIGPYAWGDGVVDFEDLRVLAEYIGTEVVDPTLIAHWAFDETEGLVAGDSAGDCDGRVIGGATWQPEAGMVGGALQLDGVTGCVSTKIVPGLGAGPFSVVAWVKGGAPGQVVLSHYTTPGWLMANPIDGSLMTKLTCNGQVMAHGYSDAVITDGKWHRIGLVWNGAERLLYVDGQEVARDAQGELTIDDGSFTIGVGDAPGTAWNGLIDDVRVFTRVVRP